MGRYINYDRGCRRGLQLLFYCSVCNSNGGRRTIRRPQCCSRLPCPYCHERLLQSSFYMGINSTLSLLLYFGYYYKTINNKLIYLRFSPHHPIRNPRQGSPFSSGSFSHERRPNARCRYRSIKNLSRRKQSSIVVARFIGIGSKVKRSVNGYQQNSYSIRIEHIGKSLQLYRYTQSQHPNRRLQYIGTSFIRNRKSSRR